MCAGLCRLVYARTKRNNEFSTTACPASDSFDIGFCVERKWMVMGTGTDPFVRVHSIFISFYTFRVCSILFFYFLVVTYFNSNFISSTPFYASNSFIFCFALARNETCAPSTRHNRIAEPKLTEQVPAVPFEKIRLLVPKPCQK
jgi:hypothetical protein